MVVASVPGCPPLLAGLSRPGELEGIANREGHSVAPICEAFLLVGSAAYKKEGGKYLRRALARAITKSSTG